MIVFKVEILCDSTILLCNADVFKFCITKRFLEKRPPCLSFLELLLVIIPFTLHPELQSLMKTEKMIAYSVFRETETVIA